MLTYKGLRQNKDSLFGEGASINIVKDSCSEMMYFKDAEGNWADMVELCVCKVQIQKQDESAVEVDVLPFKIQVPRAEAEALINV